MTENTKLNGYLDASQRITAAINESLVNGATIDEVFAAVKVQVEVLSLRLAQIVFAQQQQQMQQTQEATPQQDLDLGDKDAN